MTNWDMLAKGTLSEFESALNKRCDKCCGGTPDFTCVECTLNFLTTEPKMITRYEKLKRLPLKEFIEALFNCGNRRCPDYGRCDECRVSYFSEMVVDD